MPLNVRYAGDVAILSNVARLMNDPRYTSVGQDVGELLDEGIRKFVLELRDVREAGAPLLGVLMTLTRRIRKDGGEVVLARPSRSMEHLLETMRMEEYWDVFEDIAAAEAFFRPRDEPTDEEQP